MKIKRGIADLVVAAEAEVTSLSPAEVAARLGDDGVLLVDLRDIREKKRDGWIEGSLHVPRGMLEFWIDPDSPYYRREFDDARELILYCNKGWRSALAAQTLMQRGVDAVAHMEGGMDRWQAEIGKLCHDS
ncbi:MAG: rhodanese-like domain-containing protein [Gammaproteobacteria bacterium]